MKRGIRDAFALRRVVYGSVHRQITAPVDLLKEIDGLCPIWGDYYAWFSG